MAVPIAISREHVRQELNLAQDLASTLGWKIESDLEKLTIKVTMRAHNDDKYILIGQFDDYKEKPPLLEFVDPDTGQTSTPHAYPKCRDSLFHGNGPCICAPFSRKAYKDYRDGAPHGDWKFVDWMSAKASNVDWSNYNTLPAMLGLIQTRLSRPDLYEGRMG